MAIARIHIVVTCGLAALLATGCATTRMSLYQDIVDPMVGTSKRPDVDKVLGNPTACAKAESYTKCEYRTSAGRNAVVPYDHQKLPGFGVDLSPYEHFDVLHLYYDDFGVLKDWTPVVLTP